MAKIKNRYLTLIAWALICVLWNVIVLVVADLDIVEANFWCAFAFIDVAFVVGGVLIVLTQLKGSNPILSIHAPAYIVTLIYFAVTFVLNFFFMLCFGKGEDATALVILNAIIIVAYAVAMIVSFMGARHITANEQQITTKVSELRTLEITVGALSYKTSDAAVKNKIEELKTKIHYSDPMGVESTASAEQDIKNQVQIISELLSGGADGDVIIAAIDDAMAKVEIRNQLLAAAR